MTNPKALRPGTVLLGAHDVELAILDTLERLAPDYRDPDLPEPRFVYGDPVSLAGGFPLVAVIPEKGARKNRGCSRGTEGLDLFRLRLYHEVANPDTDPRAEWEPVVRTLDYLRALFYQNTTLPTRGGDRRVFECWPARWGVLTFQEETTAGFVAIRGGEIELDVTVNETVAQEGDPVRDC